MSGNNYLYLELLSLKYFSFRHLICNNIVQLFLGIPLELVHKWWRIGLIYLIGVISGALFKSVFDRDNYLHGASGGGFYLHYIFT